jgi:D-alanyl-D-alanine carboxypeptidase/D-alanyl-D-alanine-endopeptidase (penicillin-binding protein 4)
MPSRRPLPSVGRRRHAALRGTLALLVGLVLSAPRAASTQQKPASESSALASELMRLASSADVKGFHVGVEAIEIDSGRVLVAAGEHQALNPASNEKLVTTITALALLHPEHVFETGLYASTSRGPVISGAVVLRGYGDPSLGTGDLYEMALELKKQGIKRIDGGIVVDQRFYDELTTPPAFEQQPNEWAYFRAPVAAVSLDENVVVGMVRPGGGEGAVVQFWPPGFVDVEGTVRLSDGGGDTVRMAPGPAEADPKRMKVVVGGSIPRETRAIPHVKRVHDPQLLAGYALKAVFQDMGIEVRGEVRNGSPAAGTLLAKHKSLPLAALLLRVGKNSDNFYAEMIFKALAGERAKRPAGSADAADLAMKFLAKIGALDAGVAVKNGSGLFDANRATAHELATLLRWAYREPSIQPELLTQLSIGAADGTLHGRFKAEHARRAVRAKTGTLDDAIALSGFVLAPPGRSPVAFSILINNCKGRTAQARGFADRLVEKIAKDLWGGAG